MEQAQLVIEPVIILESESQPECIGISPRNPGISTLNSTRGLRSGAECNATEIIVLRPEHNMLCTSCNVRLTATVTALLFCAVAPPARSGEATTDKVVEAIWHVQSLPFQYDSVHASYACDSLQKKIRVILQAVGAHKSMVVRARCAGHDLLSMVSVHIALATPVEATEENIRRATTFDSRDELVARLKKITLPTPTDIARFPATWQTISLPRHPQLHLEVGDCDLLRHMNEQIFPKLAVRLIHEEPYCNASATRFRPRFEVQALIAAPVDAVAQIPPPAM